MALINCPECAKQVSNAALACPNCGYPIAERLAGPAHPGPASPLPPADPNELLAEVRTSAWGYFWYWFFFWLIVPPIIAWVRRSAVVLRVYPQRIRVERGLLSKCYQELNPRDIRAIDIDQSFFQRLVGIGDLTLSTAASADATEQLRCIPDPQGVRDLILAQRA
jgi:hypothetical protein